MLTKPIKGSGSGGPLQDRNRLLADRIHDAPSPSHEFERSEVSLEMKLP